MTNEELEPIHRNIEVKEEKIWESTIDQEDALIVISDKKYLKDVIQNTFWYERPEFKGKTPIKQYELQIRESTIQLYDFLGIPDGRIDEIASALHELSELVSAEKLGIESIQIIDVDETNSKNGELKRGVEYPSQKRFVLFPYAFEGNKYRGGEVSCSELEGTVIHEGTHVILEKFLITFWHQNREKLGWRNSGDFEQGLSIIYPGGHLGNHVNIYPENLPSSYSLIQPDDDRADSVVRWIYDRSSLKSPRREILDEALQTNVICPATIRSVPISVPMLPKNPKYFIKKAEPKGFKINQVRKSENNPRQIPLEQFYKEFLKR